MSQSVRQTARKSALQTQAKRRRERVEAERRWSALGIDVAVALTERDAAVQRYERAAGAALVKLAGEEGLTLAEACEWADNLPTAEAKRLLRLAKNDGSPSDLRGVALVAAGFEPPAANVVDIQGANRLEAKVCTDR